MTILRRKKAKRFNTLKKEYESNVLELFNYNNANIKLSNIITSLDNYNTKLEEINNTIKSIEVIRY